MRLTSGPTRPPTPLPHAEDKDTFINAVRSEVKATGMLDTAENCWDFFINKVGLEGGRCRWRWRRCCTAA
jgi:hypothetical protein